MKKLFIVMISAFVICGSSGALTAKAANPPEISAKGAVLISADTGEIVFEKNCREKLPMASTTKIMTTLLCLESGNLDEEFVVDSEAIKVEGSSMGLQEGDIIVGIGEQTILGDRTLRLSRASFAPGDIQTVYFWRDGQYYTTEMMRPET